MSTLKVTNIKSANGTSALSIADTSGNVTVGTGKVFAPNGIVFSSTELIGDDASTTNRTESSNLLDDYEEGTFTPTNGDITTFNVVTAKYTKIGRIVHLSIEFGSLVIGAGQYFSGLPFSAAEDSNGLLVDKTPTNKSHGFLTEYLGTNVYFIDSFTDSNGVFSATYITA